MEITLDKLYNLCQEYVFCFDGYYPHLVEINDRTIIMYFNDDDTDEHKVVIESAIKTENGEVRVTSNQGYRYNITFYTPCNPFNEN